MHTARDSHLRCVFVGEMLAGKLLREGGQYVFEYDSSYQGPPVFLGWDRAQSRREWDIFPAAFDSLLPEGVLLDQLLIKNKLDRSDKWGQLLAVGLDLTGFVSALYEDSGQQPIGKVTPDQQAKKEPPSIPKKVPSPQAYPGAAKNEALTMELARQTGIDGSKLSVDESFQYQQIVHERLGLLGLK